jgi:patatin-like phospholipase/acyl hydrolase
MIDWELVKCKGWFLKVPQRLRILTIDGGGIRGIFPARYLSLMESQTGRQVNEMFDLIVGASTGGIMALGLGAGIPAHEILRLYTDNAYRIFGILSPGARRITGIPLVGRWLASNGVFAPRYDSCGLKSLLSKTFESLRMRDSKTMLCIPAVEHHRASPTVFKTPHHRELFRDADRLMSEVALATSAAPTYFEPFVRGTECIIDGGLWANCPILVGVCEAVKNGFDLSKVQLLSLGTGDVTYSGSTSTARRSSIWSYRLGLLTMALSLQMQTGLNMGTYLLGDNLVRVSFTLTRSIGLDAKSKEEMDTMIQEADMAFGKTFRTGPCVERRFCT